MFDGLSGYVAKAVPNHQQPARTRNKPRQLLVDVDFLGGLSERFFNSGTNKRAGAILILVVGAINVLRAVPHPEADRPEGSAAEEHGVHDYLTRWNYDGT